MFISPALAQEAAKTASETGDGNFLVSMLPLFLILIVFYVIVIMPQNRRFAEHRRMIDNLRRGDKIVTAGGIVGTVKKVMDDGELMVEIADNVQVKIMASTIMSLKSKGEESLAATESKAA